MSHDGNLCASIGGDQSIKVLSLVVNEWGHSPC